jgi:hypothetical protein
MIDLRERRLQERPRERPPYESVLLGGFILALGHRMGTTGQLPDAFCASLFQQSPMDPVLGDVMAASEFGGFLLEFKRSWKERSQETEKRKFGIINDNPELRQRAENCHLLGYGVDGTSTSHCDIKFGSYIELVRAQEEKEVKQLWSLSEFLQGIVEHRIGGSAEELKTYLNDLFAAIDKSCKDEARQAELAGDKQGILDAKQRARELCSALTGSAVLFTGEKLYTVPFSSILEIGIVLSMENAISLKRSIEPEGYGMKPEGYGMKPDVYYEKKPDIFYEKKPDIFYEKKPYERKIKPDDKGFGRDI